MALSAVNYSRFLGPPGGGPGGALRGDPALRAAGPPGGGPGGLFFGDAAAPPLRGDSGPPGGGPGGLFFGRATAAGGTADTLGGAADG